MNNEVSAGSDYFHIDVNSKMCVFLHKNVIRLLTIGTVLDSLFDENIYI